MLEAIFERFQGVRRNGAGWMALCPAHADKNASLSINEGEGTILVKCFAGCATENVLSAVGLTMRDLFAGPGAEPRIVAEYDYLDERGELLYQVVRYRPKGFRQRQPDGMNGWRWNMNDARRVLYRLPEVLAAKSVLVVEGEKDAETGRKLGLAATCNVGGAGRWRDEYSEPLRGKHIAILADADGPGRKHVEQVAQSLHGRVETLKVLELPKSKDLSEWAERGGTREALLELIHATPEWKSGLCAPADNEPNAQIKGVTRCFADIAPEPVQWLWPGRIPLGKFTLLIGDPGLGKSMVTIDIASRISTGVNFPDGGACERGGVLLLSAEDDAADTIRPRLDAAGADVSRVHILEAVRVCLADGAVSERGFSLEADIGALEDALTRIAGIRLVVIDPISAYLGNADSHVNAEVRGLLSPLVALASRRGVAVAGVAHLRKSAGAAVHRAIGSIAFAAAARSVWAVGTDPSDPERRLVLPVKQNLAANIGGLAFRVEAPDGVPRLSWESEPVHLDANEVLMSGFDGGEGRGALREAESWLRDVLADGPVSARKIQSDARTAGLPWITVRRAKESLGVTASKAGFSTGWSWKLLSPQGAHPNAKVLTFESRASSADLSIFDGVESGAVDTPAPSPTSKCDTVAPSAAATGTPISAEPTLFTPPSERKSELRIGADEVIL